MLLLLILYSLQDITNVELHAPDEGYFQDESPHKVVEYLTTFSL
mgnify:CR=1 FL=1